MKASSTRSTCRPGSITRSRSASRNSMTFRAGGARERRDQRLEFLNPVVRHFKGPTPTRGRVVPGRTMPMATVATPYAAPEGMRRRIAWRILPLLGVAYLFAYMDRVNISFASLTMNADLGFSATVYGLGGGLFFLAYALFEVPSNMVLARVGARKWIARIMITWGLLA